MKEWILQKRWRIILSGILVTALPLIGLALLVNSELTSALEERVLAGTRSLAASAAHDIEQSLKNDIKLGKLFSTRPDLLAALKRRDRKEVSSQLMNFIKNSDAMERVSLTDSRGIQIANYPFTAGTVGRDFSKRDWYKGVSKDWEPYVSGFFFRMTKPRRHLFAIAVPIRSSEQVIAVLVMQPKEDYIKNSLSGIDAGKGLIYVVDKRGHVVYHPNYPSNRIEDFSSAPIVQKVLKGTGGVERTNSASASLGSVVAAYSPVKAWGWGVVVEKPVSLVLAPVRKITIWIMTITGAMLLMGGFFAYRWAEILFESQKLSQELKHHAERLDAANKDLESFSYSISHDLRSPLRAIDGFSRILTKDYAGKLDSEGIRLLNVVRANAQKMGELIDDILAFSRVGRAEISFSEIDMEALAKTTCEKLASEANGRSVSCEIGPLPRARGDRAMMTQVFMNLLSNAVKFTAPRDTARIEVGARENGGEETLYYVKDNGVGFEAAYSHKLFGVFQRLHGMDEFEGTGIGLSIVKRIVEKHGGRVCADGAVDRGAEFYFTLPQRNNEINP